MVNEGAEHDEVDRYLREANVPISLRIYWKEHEREFPVLSRLARDLLSVPATGAGVERLFNNLMMYMCREKFTLEGQQSSLMEKPMESKSQEALEEDEALKANKEDVAPISDDEEVEESEDIDGNIVAEETNQVEGMLAEAG
ncbi:hypothetical protein N7447_010501 [Penicillium robsamsonii]|uniref:uncharacterized protein n=1 Tax=Penicillium robsamsonii TaxID=1792511 RepID=UPI002548EB3C|nr:uncharacterized protein N7447_010501 [Penicillium robsamsonii]KAJ5810985.1 hypothetical protein N7447_010501 [Penicillium robsamsonii]